MPDTIRDGKGSGSLAGVDSENRLMTRSTAETMIAHVNVSEGKAYSLIVSKTPTGAGSCFCYIKNTSDENLLINSIKLYSATTDTVQIKVKDTGTASGGTAITPVGRNTNYTTTADGTFEEGANITGLSGGSVIEQLVIEGGKSSARFGWDSQLAIAPNSVLTFYAVTGTYAIKMTVSFYFHE